MTEEKLHELQVLLYETGEKELRDIALMLNDNKRGDMGLIRQTDKKLYKAFLRLIDPQSSNLLKRADKNITKMWNKLFRDGGWYASRIGITQIDSEETMMQDFPHEVVEGRRLYHLDRDENGYHTQDFVPEEHTIYYYARQTEEQFMKEKKVEIETIHTLYKIKEQIMGGDYELENPSYAPLVEMICEYFGYEKQPEKVPTK